MPFIDERKLLDAAASVPAEALSAEERGRNRLGDILAFRHAPGGGAPRPARSASGRVRLHVALLTRPGQLARRKTGRAARASAVACSTESGCTPAHYLSCLLSGGLWAVMSLAAKQEPAYCCHR